MFQPISIAFFIAFFVWIGSILFSTKSETRMERACIPIEWSGKGISSVTKLVNVDMGLDAEHYTHTWTWGCKYVLWDLFYKSDWVKEQGQAQGESASAVQGTGKEASK